MADNLVPNLDIQRMAEFGVFSFAMATFTGLIQLQYKETSAIATHSAVMMIFIIALLVFVTIVLWEVSFGTPPEPHCQILDKIRLLVMAWAVVSLVLIVSPFLGWFIFVIWVFFVAKVTHGSYQQLYHLIYQAISKIKELLGGIMSRTDSNADEQV